jgi:tRNA dimethylallyltransferase
MRAVGYRQAWSFLEGRIDEAQLRAQGIAATRQLAKRQLTWLRSFPGLLRLDSGGLERAAVALDLLLHEAR